MTATELTPSCTDLIDQYREVLANEIQPHSYRWYATQPVYEALLDELTPVARFDWLRGVQTRTDGSVLLKTDYGSIECYQSNGLVSGAGERNGEVTARLYDGDAILVRYRHHETPSDVEP